MPLASIRAAAAALCVATGAFADDRPVQPEDTSERAANRTVTAAQEMVVAAHPLAAEAGAEVLVAGGSAADAAVAVQLVLNLVEPQSSGLGGGGFLLYWDAALNELTAHDAREIAPMAAAPDYWLDDNGAPLPFWDAVIGGRSVGVPGVPMLLEHIHQRHGRLPWAGLFDPALQLAEDGFEVSPRMAESIAGARGLDRHPATAAYFHDSAGAPLAAGTRLKNPDFARTLRLMRDQGAAPFYSGSIARDIVATVRADDRPGLLTMEDFAGYEVVMRDPVCLSYRGDEVCGMGPPSSGALTVGQMLGMLERFDLARIGPGPEAAHLIAEAGRLAFADRGLYMADADFVSMPEGLLNTDYLAQRAQLIDADAVMETPAQAGTPPWRDAAARGADAPQPRGGTTHFVIRDRHGDMVSATTTIEMGFGARLMTNGFLLNNELTDFAFRPVADGAPVANRVEGGKRPRSSMAPTIVLRDGVPFLALGSPGGANIIAYVASALIGILDWEMDLQTAFDRPHVLNRNGPTFIEEGPGADAMAAQLQMLGHETVVRDLNSGLHALMVTSQGLIGAADQRREGRVSGQ